MVRARLPYRHYPLRNGTLFNIVAVFRTSTYAERGDIAGYRAELDRTYRDSHPTMKASAGDDGSGAALGDLRPRSDPALEPGPRDAARRRRASRPCRSLAQGACMAIEDAVTLAELHRATGGDFAAAFRAYEKARYLRTARVQFEVAAITGTISIMSAASSAKSRARSGRLAPSEDMFDCLAWLYDGFPLPAARGAAA